MSAANQTSHPVEVECPSCRHRFRVPLSSLSLGESLPCGSCGGDILLATPALRQLLREIDNDLRTPDDRPILLQPTEYRPASKQGAGRDRTWQK